MIDDAVVEAAIRDVLKKRWLIGWWLRWRKLIKADLDKVSSLDLSQTQITDAGLKEVAKMKQLKGLGLGGCKQITAENVAELTKALPKCDIYF